jgi:nitrous oxidase accessory protein NosD
MGSPPAQVPRPGRSHPPIAIDGDSAFNASNGVTSGNGSPADPFVIGNWVIAAGSGSALSVVNTRAHFAVRDCSLDTADPGVAAVFLENVTDGALELLSVSNGSDRVIVSLSSRVRIADSSLGGEAQYGVRIRDSADLSLVRTTITGSREAAVEAFDTTGLRVTDNVFAANPGVAFRGFGTRQSLVSGNRVLGGGTGIWMDSAGEVEVRGNRIENVSWDAISLFAFRGGNVSSNQVDGADIGLRLGSSESGPSNGTNVSHNLVTRTRRGLWLSLSMSTALRNNTIRDATEHGLVIEASPGSSARGNRIETARWGLSVRSVGGSVAEYDLDLAPDNLVDGRPVRYIRHQRDPVVPLGAGYIGLVNVSGNVRPPDISGSGEGVLVAASSDLRVELGELRSNDEGVVVVGSTDVVVTGAVVEAAEHYGISVRDSVGIAIRGSRVLNTTYTGVRVDASSAVTVEDSRVSGSGVVGISATGSTSGLNVTRSEMRANSIGVEMRRGSRSSSVWGNDFVDNRLQALDDGEGNRWDSASGGNFWSGHSGLDADCDGRFDAPYAMPAGTALSRDQAPLVKSVFSAIPPCAPVPVKAEFVSGAVLLSWSPPGWDGDSPVVGYRVARGASSSDLEVIAATTATGYSDTAVERGRSYRYAVSAVNAAGQGPSSVPVEVWTLPGSKPSDDPGVVSLRVEPESPFEGIEARIRMVIANTGSLAAAGVNARIEAEEQGAWVPVPGGSAEGVSLLPGATLEVAAGKSFNAGAHRIRGLLYPSGSWGGDPGDDLLEQVVSVSSNGGPETHALRPSRGAWNSLFAILAAVVLLLGVGLAAARHGSRRIRRPPAAAAEPGAGADAADRSPAATVTGARGG